MTDAYTYGILSSALGDFFKTSADEKEEYTNQPLVEIWNEDEDKYEFVYKSEAYGKTTKEDRTDFVLVWDADQNGQVYMDKDNIKSGDLYNEPDDPTDDNANFNATVGVLQGLYENDPAFEGFDWESDAGIVQIQGLVDNEDLSGDKASVFIETYLGNKMKNYHTKQAAELKASEIGYTDKKTISNFTQQYHFFKAISRGQSDYTYQDSDGVIHARSIGDVGKITVTDREFKAEDGTVYEIGELIDAKHRIEYATKRAGLYEDVLNEKFDIQVGLKYIDGFGD